MKKSLPICFLFFTSFILNAQIISVSPSIVDANFQGIDMTNNFEDLLSTIAVTNLTDSTIQLKWEREMSSDCNGSWETYIADNNASYYPGINTNWGPNANTFDVYQAVELDPNETYDEFVLHILPRMNTGCCDIKIHFSLTEEPDSILATATFATYINMNDDCSGLTSNQEVEAAKAINVFPSPTTDLFQLTENEVVDQISVYNAVGQLVETFNYIDGTQYDLSNEADGLYFLKLLNEKGENLKLLPLVKD